MKKRIPIFLLGAVIVIALFVAGCNGDSDVNGDETDETEETAEPIKIGIIGPMDMKLGEHLFISAEMAAEEINADGGIQVGDTKRPIELVKKDSGEYKNVSDAAAAAEQLINRDKVDFMIGGIVAEAVSVMQDVAADNEVIYISNSFEVGQAHVDRLKDEYDRYKYCFSSSSEVTSGLAAIHLGILNTVAEAVKKTGVPTVRVALLVQKTTGGDAIHDFIKGQLTQQGMEITGSWRPSVSASDLRAEASAIMSSKPHIIYAVFSGSAGIVFGEQMKELQIPAIIAGSPASSTSADEGIDYSVTMMTPITIADKITDYNLDFYNEFLKRSNNQLCLTSTYGTIMNLKQCIETAGTLEAEAIIEAMETEEFMGVVGKTKFDMEHKVVYLEGWRPTYGVQRLPDGGALVVWPPDSPNVDIKPVEIPQWMLDAWEDY